MISNNLKSNRPNRLLVAADGSDTSMNAVDYAITLAKNDNSDNQQVIEIFVINVIDIPPIFKLLPSDTRNQLTRIGRQQAGQIFDEVDEIAKRHNATNLNIVKEMVETSSGSAADEIIKYAKEKDVDLIVVGN